MTDDSDCLDTVDNDTVDDDRNDAKQCIAMVMTIADGNDAMVMTVGDDDWQLWEVCWLVSHTTFSSCLLSTLQALPS